MLWVLAAVVLLLDQGTKSVIVAWLDWGESWPAEGFFAVHSCAEYWDGVQSVSGA